VSTPQNTIAIVYDYDQTLSPSYMQEDVIFPAFGINGESFWRRCAGLMREQGYDNELAYMKVMLDTFGMDRPTNAELKKLGSNLNFYKGLPEMFEQFRNNLLTEALSARRSRQTYRSGGLPAEHAPATAPGANGGGDGEPDNGAAQGSNRNRHGPCAQTLNKPNWRG
jgi:hypothetical protein